MISRACECVDAFLRPGILSGHGDSVRDELFAAGGQLSPVEVDVGEEEIADGEEEEFEGKGGLGHVEVLRNWIGDADDDEVQGEDVGADHPLAMGGELAVAGGDEGGESTEKPHDRHDGVGELHGCAGGSELEIEGEGCGNGDAGDVDAAHDAMALEVSRAEAGGEEEWAEKHCEQRGGGVRDEEEAVVDEPRGIGVGVIDDGVLGEDEDGDGGEADGDPEGGFGEAFAASGWGCMRRGGHGRGRHRVIRSEGLRVSQIVVAGMLQDSWFWGFGKKFFGISNRFSFMFGHGPDYGADESNLPSMPYGQTTQVAARFL
jgi:hypothetical protein